MPTYTYKCTSCDELFEMVQSFTDDPLTSCPNCDGTIQKKFNSVGVVFKGPGFYQTDKKNTPAKHPKKEEKTTSKAVSTDKSTTKKSKQ